MDTGRSGVETRPPAATGGPGSQEGEPMETKTLRECQDSPTADRIDGPIAEFDRDGEATGHDYYRCTACGREAMYRADLSGCCEP